MTGFLQRACLAWLLHALFVASVLATTFPLTPEAQAQLLPGGDSASEETAAAPADDWSDDHAKTEQKTGRGRRDQ